VQNEQILKTNTCDMLSEVVEYTLQGKIIPNLSIIYSFSCDNLTSRTHVHQPPGALWYLFSFPEFQTRSCNKYSWNTVHCSLDVKDQSINVKRVSIKIMKFYWGCICKHDLYICTGWTKYIKHGTVFKFFPELYVHFILFLDKLRKVSVYIPT
jgi:hypothetical protein